MMNNFKKIIASLLVLSFILGTYGFPQKAEAIGGAGDTVIESGPSLWEQIVQTVNSGITSASTYSLELKAFVLDTLATSLAKTLIRKMTADVVDWINGGFEGSPAFVTNPGGFMIDVADQISGEFLSKVGGPLADLCNAFSIDIRLALAFKYHPKTRKKYECTLSKIINNVQNAGDNITINGKNVKGFLNGDFDQGGWPAFVTLTTDNSSNPYGAYLEANSELSIRVANARLEKRNEISNGSGFLSWRNPKCKAEVKAYNEQKTKEWEALENSTGADYNAANANVAGGESSALKSVDSCEIETPGSFIAGALGEHGNGPLHELELVDSINEIVNALAAQLINTILTGGLRAISGSSSSDSTAYIREVQTEAQQVDSTQMQELRSRFIGDIQKARDNTAKLKGFKDKSLNTMINIKKTYESAKACWAVKNLPPTYPYNIKISEIDSILAGQVTPQASKLLTEATAADSLLTKLKNISEAIWNAKTLNEINAPTQEFTSLHTSGRLTTAKEIADADLESQTIAENSGPLLTDAKRKLQECQIVTTGSSTVGNTSTNSAVSDAEFNNPNNY